MTGSPRPRRESGLSILECVVCLSILVVLLGAVTSSRDREMRWVADTYRETAAERAASSRLEEIAEAGTAPRAGTRAFVLDDDSARILGDARCEEEVREAGPGLVAVEVRVRWRSVDGSERTAVLATLVATGGGR